VGSAVGFPQILKTESKIKILGGPAVRAAFHFLASLAVAARGHPHNISDLKFEI
jgi:hypothetical protein